MEELSIFWLSVLLVILIFISAFFSGSETSMMAINRYRLRSLAQKHRGAKRTQRLLENVDELIGAILLGNNFVNILASSIATIIAIHLWGEGSVIYASVLLTFVILIFAETTPKTFAAKFPEKVAIPSSLVISLVIKIFKPFVWLVSLFSKSILKILGVSNNGQNTHVSSEELKMVVDDAKRVISSKYQKMLKNIIDLENVRVEDIMIPRNELISVDINKQDELLDYLKRVQHTRLLIYKDTPDNITGVLHMRNVVNLYANDEFSIDNVIDKIREPYFVPEGTSLSDQLEHFQKQKRRLGLVVNEYGEVRGMIVLEDILEEIVGQFTSNQSENIEEIIKQDDGTYLIDPRVSIRELNDALDTDFSPDRAKTLNGLILDELQMIPTRDISLKVDSIMIEILQISGNAIKLVKVTKLDPSE
ncbi:HlyC/CorC family transporter [Gammaproteobacteria bacterium]|nr:HlyC/CorC family transporter [Gammaproteobacteria bacterium]